jgi:hypothetical protein
MPKKVARKVAPKSAPKRVPKKALPRADYRTLDKTEKIIKQQGKELAQLQRELVSAKRSRASSRKPQSIKDAAKLVKQLEKETRQQQKNFKNNVTALGKLIDAFQTKKKPVKPSTKAAVTKAKKIQQSTKTIVQKSAPVIKRVPKKKVAAKKVVKKTPTKAAKKVPKKAAKRAPKKASKKAAKKAPAPPKYKLTFPRHWKEQIKHPTLKQRDELKPNEFIAIKVSDNLVSDVYSTWEQANDKMTEYLVANKPDYILHYGKVETSFTKFGGKAISETKQHITALQKSNLEDRAKIRQISAELEKKTIAEIEARKVQQEQAAEIARLRKLVSKKTRSKKRGK